MNPTLARRIRGTASAVLGMLLVAAATAVAAPLLTSTGIKDESILGRDLRNGTVASVDVLNNGVLGIDIRNGTLTAADLAANSVGVSELADSSVTGVELADGSVGGPELADGSVAPVDLSTATITSLTDTSPWETIPSGVTVTGAFRKIDTDPVHGAIDTMMFQLPARPPVELGAEGVKFAPHVATDTGVESAACTGSTTNPTAPAGLMCLYLGYAVHVKTVTPGGFAPGAWYIDWIWDHTSPAFAGLHGSWAYTAP